MTTLDIKNTNLPLPEARMTADELPSRNDKELEDYRQKVERLAELNSDEIFSNAQADHAAVIFQTFFERATKSVYIFCSDLSAKVFGRPEVLSSLEGAVARKIDIRIVTQKEPEESAFVKAVKRLAEQKALILRVNGSHLVSDIEENFSIMDTKAYRYEPQKAEPKAFACMNNPKISKGLVDFFYTIENCTV